MSDDGYRMKCRECGMTTEVGLEQRHDRECPECGSAVVVIPTPVSPPRADGPVPLAPVDVPLAGPVEVDPPVQPPREPPVIEQTRAGKAPRSHKLDD